MKKIRAFSPGHITGLFYMYDQDEDPLRRGSLGAGFSLSRGTLTTLHFRSSADFSASFSINNNSHINAIVSRKVVDLFFAKTNLEKRGLLEVKHQVQVPEGSGFGSSGSGALSLALALNELYQNPLDYIEASRVAHIAEVECRTGLGTVLGESLGGFKVSVYPGGPGIGQVKPIPYETGLTAVFAVYGPYSTSSALVDPRVCEKVLAAGNKYHTLLKQNPTADRFLSYSRSFADEADLYTPRIKHVLKLLDKQGITATMLMFGEGIFTLVPEAKAENVRKKFQESVNTALVFTSLIDPQGGRIVDDD